MSASSRSICLLLCAALFVGCSSRSGRWTRLPASEPGGTARPESTDFGVPTESPAPRMDRPETPPPPVPPAIGVSFSKPVAAMRTIGRKLASPFRLNRRTEPNSTAVSGHRSVPVPSGDTACTAATGCTADGCATEPCLTTGVVGNIPCGEAACGAEGCCTEQESEECPGLLRWLREQQLKKSPSATAGCTDCVVEGCVTEGCGTDCNPGCGDIQAGLIHPDTDRKSNADAYDSDQPGLIRPADIRHLRSRSGLSDPLDDPSWDDDSGRLIPDSGDAAPNPPAQPPVPTVPTLPEGTPLLNSIEKQPAPQPQPQTSSIPRIDFFRFAPQASAAERLPKAAAPAPVQRSIGTPVYGTGFMNQGGDLPLWPRLRPVPAHARLRSQQSLGGYQVIRGESGL